MKVRRLGIIGCGNMGSAVAVSAAKNTDAGLTRVLVYDKAIRKAERLTRHKKVSIRRSIPSLVKDSDAVIIAVKPQDALSVLDAMGKCVSRSQLVISIMAGVTLKTIAAHIGGGVPSVRVMPNIAAMVGHAVTGMSYNRVVRPDVRAASRRICGSIGVTCDLKEHMMDAITAVTGSGPAYVYYFIEALVDAAVELGINKKDALRLVLETMKGSLLLADETAISPAELRKRVTSKGGTTEEAIRVFEKKGLRRIVAMAVGRAAKRSAQLSR